VATVTVDLRVGRIRIETEILSEQDLREALDRPDEEFVLCDPGQLIFTTKSTWKN